MHTRFSSSRSTRRAAGVGALILLASSLLCLNAATISGRGALISPPFTAEIGDQVVVAVSNFGRRAIQFRVLLLDATNFQTVVISDLMMLEPMTANFADSTLGVGFGFTKIIAVIEYQSPGKNLVKASLQVREPGPEGPTTTIFSDGFESGDVSM